MGEGAPNDFSESEPLVLPRAWTGVLLATPPAYSHLALHRPLNSALASFLQDKG